MTFCLFFHQNNISLHPINAGVSLNSNKVKQIISKTTF